MNAYNLGHEFAPGYVANSTWVTHGHIQADLGWGCELNGWLTNPSLGLEPEFGAFVIDSVAW